MRALTLTLLSTGALVLGLTAGLPDAREAVAAEQVAATATKHKKSSGKLVVTRTDGSTFTIPARGLKIRCKKLETEPPVRGILLSNPRYAFEDGSEEPVRPILFVEAVLADIRKGVTVKLPTEGNVGDPARASIFIGDVGGPGRADRANINELSSDQEDSAGTMFVRGKCGKHARLKVRINGTLGSEFHDSPSVRVRGTLVGRG